MGLINLIIIFIIGMIFGFPIGAYVGWKLTYSDFKSEEQFIELDIGHDPFFEYHSIPKIKPGVTFKYVN